MNSGRGPWKRCVVYAHFTAVAVGDIRMSLWVSWISTCLSFIQTSSQITHCEVLIYMANFGVTKYLHLSLIKNSTALKWTVTGRAKRLLHTMDLLWEKFQCILPLYMKPISFQSKASVVCSVTAAIFIGFCLKKVNVFSQHIGKKQMNIRIPQNKSPGIEMLINFLC